jgi:hypothetical protein
MNGPHRMCTLELTGKRIRDSSKHQLAARFAAEQVPFLSVDVPIPTADSQAAHAQTGFEARAGYHCLQTHPAMTTRGIIGQSDGIRYKTALPVCRSCAKQRRLVSVGMLESRVKKGASSGMYTYYYIHKLSRLPGIHKTILTG